MDFEESDEEELEKDVLGSLNISGLKGCVLKGCASSSSLRLEATIVWKQRRSESSVGAIGQEKRLCPEKKGAGGAHKVRNETRVLSFPAGRRCKNEVQDTEREEFACPFGDDKAASSASVPYRGKGSFSKSDEDKGKQMVRSLLCCIRVSSCSLTFLLEIILVCSERYCKARRRCGGSHESAGKSTRPALPPCRVLVDLSDKLTRFSV